MNQVEVLAVERVMDPMLPAGTEEAITIIAEDSSLVDAVIMPNSEPTAPPLPPIQPAVLPPMDMIGPATELLPIHPAALPPMDVIKPTTTSPLQGKIRKGIQDKMTAKKT